MKPIEGYNKLRGGYYTPDKISEFITDWAVKAAADTILEPSCGDGSFLNAITHRLKILGATRQEVKKNVIGVELDSAEAEKAAQYGTTVVCKDFFSYFREVVDDKKKFDAIVGNPPFIRYQNFNEEYREIAFTLMNKYGFKPNRLTNIWLPFLLLSCNALKPNGRLGMVIPAELFQVDYAAEARQFLSGFFDRLTIITFKQLVFDDIQQEVVLLLGERGCEKQRIRIVELNNIEDLISQGQKCLDAAEQKQLDTGKDKWVKYYLTNEELQLLKKLDHDSRISNATDLYEVNVGLVSGENDFFILNRSVVAEHNLESTVLPIVSRSEQLKGIQLKEKDFDCLIDAGKKVFFFAPGNAEVDDLTKEQKEYIEYGEENGYNKNYKCRIRPKWYYVSSTWDADAFLIRQAHLYPRMILNKKNALVTDTLHKVRFLQGVQGECVAAAFLNTYTFALSEILGRSYGGGVLTFEPGEMRKFRIPMRGAEQLDLSKIDGWQRKGEIDKILEYTDGVLLREGLGLTQYEIALLHSIWNKMRDRRMARKNRKRKS
mgnify:FL=1